jgi:hypothetical protein
MPPRKTTKVSEEEAQILPGPGLNPDSGRLNELAQICGGLSVSAEGAPLTQTAALQAGPSSGAGPSAGAGP